MKITVLGWEKVHCYSRKDVTSPTWFKFKNKFFYDKDFFSFTPGEKLFWIFLLSELSIANKGPEIVIDVRYAAHILLIEEQLIRSAIFKLKQLRIVRVDPLRGRYVSVTHTSCREEKRREEKNIMLDSLSKSASVSVKSQPKESTIQIDLNPLYELYPRKEGKKRGLEKLSKQIKSQNDFERVKKAIMNYRAKIQSENIDAKYIKHFSSFASCWEDYEHNHSFSLLEDGSKKTPEQLAADRRRADEVMAEKLRLVRMAGEQK